MQKLLYFILPLFLFGGLLANEQPCPCQDKATSESALTLEENLHNGRMIKLSDGSLWEIAPQNLHISEVWILPIPIEVEKSDHHIYPYYLVNKTSQTRVLARPLSSNK
jgi:hypothetical protein